MQLDNIVTSVSYAERLRVLGFPQDKSNFYWVKLKSELKSDPYNLFFGKRQSMDIIIQAKNIIAAPVTDELWGYFPSTKHYGLRVHDNEDGYFFADYGKRKIRTHRDWKRQEMNMYKMVDAVASLLIWSVENSHIKFDKSHEVPHE